MDTRSVKLMAVILVAVCAVVSVSTAINVLNDNSHEAEEEKGFLAGLNDGDGFGLQFAADQDNAYAILKIAVDSLDAENFSKVNEDLGNFLLKVQENKTFEDYKKNFGEISVPMFSVDLATNALIGTQDDCRTVDLKGTLNATVSIMHSEDAETVDFPEGTIPVDEVRIAIGVDFAVHAVIGDDKVKSVSYSADYRFGIDIASNYKSQYVLGKEFAVYSDKLLNESIKAELQASGSIGIAEDITLSEIVEYLLTPESEGSLNVTVSSLITLDYLENYQDSDAEVPEKTGNGMQTSFSRTFDLPPGMAAGLFEMMGLESPTYSAVKETALAIRSEGMSYESASKIFDMFGIPLTEEQYDILLGIKNLNGLPQYDVMAPLLENMGIYVDEFTYAMVKACFNTYCHVPDYGDISLLFGMAGMELTKEQYDAIQSSLSDGLLPPFESISPVFETYPIPVDHDMYEDIRSMVNPYLADRTYENFIPIAEFAGFGISQEQYDAIFLLCDSLSQGLTAEDLYTVTSAYGLEMTLPQCQLVVSIIYDVELPAYAQIQPLLEQFGLDVGEEQYNSIAKVVGILKTFPGYFSMEYLSEKVGYFIDEGTYTDTATFLRAYFEGFKELVGSNCRSYIQLGDLSVGVDSNRAAIDGRLSKLTFSGFNEKWVDEPEYTVFYEMCQSYAKVTDFICDNEEAFPKTINGYPVAVWYADSFNFVDDHMLYEIRTYYSIDLSGNNHMMCRAEFMGIIDDGYKGELVLPSKITVNGNEYEVGLNDPIYVPKDVSLRVNTDVRVAWIMQSYGDGKLIIDGEIIGGSYYYRNVSGLQIEFVHTYEGMAFSINAINGNLIRAELIGYTGSSDVIDVSKPIEMDGKIYFVTGVNLVVNEGAKTLKLNPCTMVRSIQGIETLSFVGGYGVLDDMSEYSALKKVSNILYNIQTWYKLKDLNLDELHFASPNIKEINENINYRYRYLVYEFGYATYSVYGCNVQIYSNWTEYRYGSLSVPFEVMDELAERGIVSSCFSIDGQFEKDAVVPYDIRVLDINSIIGEMVQSVTFNGNIGKIVSGWWNPTVASSLETLIFNGTVGDVNVSSFHDCLWLSKVEFNSDVGTISGSSFLNCERLDSIAFNGTVGYIGYNNLDSSKISFGPDGRIAHLGNSAVMIDVSKEGAFDEYQRILSHTDSAEEFAFSLMNTSSVDTSSYDVSAGQYVGGNYLYKRNGETMVHLRSPVDGTVPATVDGYKVGRITLDSHWILQNGELYIPAGAEVTRDSDWSRISSVVSDSEYVIVRGSSDGIQTIMDSDGVLFIFLGSSDSYVIPSELSIDAGSLRNFLVNRNIRNVSIDGSNPHMTVVHKNGFYSVIYDSELLYVTGSNESASYEVPSSVRFFWHPYSIYSSDAREVLKDLGITSISVESGNPLIDAVSRGGFCTLLHNHSVSFICGNGDTYYIPAGVSGDISEYIDLRGKAVDVSDNPLYRIIPSGDYSTLVHSDMLIHIWKTGGSNVYAVPDEIHSVNFNEFDGLGIETVQTGNATYAYGSIGAYSSIRYVIVGNENIVWYCTINKPLNIFSVPENKAVGTYQKSENGVVSQYVKNRLVYAEIESSHTGDAILNIDNGTTQVDVRSARFDAVSLPGTLIGSNYVVADLGIQYDRMYNSYEQYYYLGGIVKQISLGISGGRSYPEAYPDMDIIDVDGNVVTVTFTAAAPYTFGGQSSMTDTFTFGESKRTISLTLPTYTISFDVQNPVLDTPAPLTDVNVYTDVLYYAPTPSLSKSVFGGWFLDADCTVPAPATGYTQDTTLYAKWLRYCSVVIHNENFDIIPDYEGNRSWIIVEGNPIPYRGWSDNMTMTVFRDLDTGTVLTVDDPVTSDMEVIIEHVPYHYVRVHSFIGNMYFQVVGGSIFKSELLRISDEFELEGIYLDRSYTKRFDPNTQIYGDLDLYANVKWVPGSNSGYNLCIDGGYRNFYSAESFYVGNGYLDIYNEYGHYDYMSYDHYYGYRFVGFVIDGTDTILETGKTYPVNGNMFIRAVYEPIVYTVSYVVDKDKGSCNMMTEDVYAFNNRATLPEVTPKDGYRFVGWVSGFRIIDELYVDDDMILYAAFVRTDIQKFTVTFECDEGTLEYDSKVYNDLDILLSLPDVYLEEGLEFLGWYYGDKPVSLPMLVKSDMVLTAVIKTPVYTVTVINDGVIIETYEVETADLAVMPSETPSKDSTAQYDFVFTEWQKTSIPGKITYTAVYQEKVRSYTIQFTANGSIVSSAVLEYGADIIAPAENPVKATDETNTYSFMGWEGYTAPMTVTGNATFDAVFEGETRLYDIVFMNGEATVASYQLGYGVTIIAPAEAPAKESTAQYDYEFIGWKDLTSSTTVTGNAAFAAEYAEKIRSYTVSFYGDNGELFFSAPMQYGTVVTAPSGVPSKVMDDYFTYTFKTWTGLEATTTVTGEMSFNAEFAEHERQYKVEFFNDGALFKSYTAGFGKKIVVAEDPSREPTETVRYIFAGWEGLTDETTVNGDMAFHATYTETVRLYHVEFVFEGVSVLVNDYEFNQNIVAPAENPVKQNTVESVFSFREWRGFQNGMVANNDFTFVAEFNVVAHPYTLTFLVDGEEFTHIDTAYGRVFTLPETVPTKEADGNATYAFIGWEGFTAGIVTGNVSFNALFQAGQQVTNENGSVTTTVETDNGGTKVTTYEKDGSSNSVETVSDNTKEQDKNGNEVDVSSETRTQISTNKFGESTETVVENKSSDSAVQTKTESSQVDKDKNGNIVSTSNTVGIESKDYDVKTTAQTTTGNAGSVSKTETVIENSADASGTTTVDNNVIDVALEQMEEVKGTLGDTSSKNLALVAKDVSDKSETVISTEALSKISEKDVTLDVKTSVGTISFGSDITKTLSETDNGSVSLGIAKVDNSTLTDAQQRVVKDHTVIQLTATVGETAVHQLGGIATITVPYDLKPYENPANITVWFVDDVGHFFKRLTTYDAASGTITFETEHFSCYVISQESDLGNADKDSEDFDLAIVGIALGAILVVAIGVFIIRARKH